LVDYAKMRSEFRWDDIRAELTDRPDEDLNIAVVAVDRHVREGRGDKIALRWLGKRGDRVELTYARLERQTNRFANVLAGLGVQPGETVYCLTGRVPSLYIGALGTLKYGAVFCPLFSAFGPEPILTRMTKGDARVLITTRRLYEKKVTKIRDELPNLRHVLIVDDDPPPGTLSFDAVMADASDAFTPAPTPPETPALLHFTSGTTGAPKGALHVHGAVVAHYATGRLALDLRPVDVYWCTADPGWVTGTSYGIISPLTNGVTLVVDEAEFDARRWYETLQNEKVTVWYTAPTAIRMLMKAGTELAKSYDLSAVRFIASVGEPLNPEAIYWGLEAYGQAIHDNWWQTETGGIMVANYAGVDVKPGSMGLPLPGIDVEIVEHTDDGIEVITKTGREGELALRPGWPSMFRAYLGEQKRYDKCFQDGWYLSGDLARCDEDGYFWFLGRADDLIKSAGHLIGPFEVESALLEHPDVVEAGVIGKPDPIAGAVVKAFVALRSGAVDNEAFRRNLMAFARKRLGSAVAPREIEVVPSLPKTRSGKIMRRLLKARELGLPEGDTSTLETST
jgi:acetyl-CoA synthetase